MSEPSQDQLIFLLTVGTIGVLVLAFFTILFFFTYQRRMVRAQQEKQNREMEFNQQMVYAELESQERERKRIASDLHDSLGSLLWSAKVNAAFIERSVLLQGETRESYRELMLSLDESINVVRRIAWELTPEAFQHMGLSQSLVSLCKNLNKKPMRVSFSEEGENPWKDERAMQVYRIAQELISNSIKHSKANELKVFLKWSKDNLMLVVEDDGIGFSLQGMRKGVGWWNIEQRAGQLKAKITMEKSPIERGTCVILNIPLNHVK
jgi:two-component system, NarL family, sensor kinase